MPELLPGLRPWALIYLPADVKSSAMNQPNPQKPNQPNRGTKKATRLASRLSRAISWIREAIARRGPGSGQSARADKK
jgi:hypothetical protein